jgi:hypothetical protein
MTFAQYSQPEGSTSYVIGGSFARESSVLTVADVLAARSKAAVEGAHDPQAGASRNLAPADEARRNEDSAER